MADIAPVTAEAFPEQPYQETAVDPQTGRHDELIADAISVPVGHNQITLIVHRIDFPDTPDDLVVKCRADLSLDGGVTFSPKPSGEKVWPFGQFPMSFGASGGLSLGPDGKPATTSGLVASIPDASNPLRMVRVTFVPLKGIRAKVEVLTEKR